MSIMRSFFLACSQSAWMRERATRYGFVRRAVSRFMPGETAQDALSAALQLQRVSIGCVFTRLGENVTDRAEANEVTEHYLGVLDHIRELGLAGEVSVKLTQIGLDLSTDLAFENLVRIIQHARAGSVVWIDMEASNYVDVTLDLFRRARSQYANTGICVQAYLYRTAKDLESLIPLGSAVRLVKGAYQESPDVAFARKSDVDENYFKLVQQLLTEQARSHGVRTAFATHDVKLIRRIIGYVESEELGKSSFEFQMLYGIQREEQLRLARQGWKSIVLIAYGSFWFPWYMRRLAERPANVFFVLRNLLSA
jgi:proline dehydrogenase